MSSGPGGKSSARSGAGRRGFASATGALLLFSTIALAVVGTALVFAGDDFDRVVWGPPGGSGLWALGFSAAGYPITRRHPANPVGWLLMVAGAAAGANTIGFGILAHSGDLPLWLLNTWVVSVAALSTAVVSFPSGSPPSRWWWAQLGLLWAIGSLQYFQEYDTSAGFVGLPGWLDAFALPLNVAFQLSLAACFLALLARWRRSDPVERTQLKWVVYSVALLAATALVVEVVLATLFPDLYLAGTIVLYVAIFAVPVAIGVAMLRYRLYDIDVVINLTLVYAALSATLVAVYFGGIVVLQRIFSVLTGHDDLPQLAIVVSTLAIAALFNPLRRRIQVLIDRRFYRRKYDARNTLAAFSTRLREETDLDVLGDNLVAVVRNTMQPEHVSLWLKPPGDVRKSGRDGDEG